MQLDVMDGVKVALASLINQETYWRELDLQYLADQVCDENYPLAQWKPDLAAKGLLLYKRFLWLCLKYPDSALVPTKDMDEFWHNHILHTRRYFKDCQNLFGRYLHHIPSDPNGDFDELKKGFALLEKLYSEEFNEPLEVLGL